MAYMYFTTLYAIIGKDLTKTELFGVLFNPKTEVWTRAFHELFPGEERIIWNL